MNIFIEDIIANGIIEQYKLNGTRKISFNSMEKYGKEVVIDLNKRGIKSMRMFSEYLTSQFDKMYKDWFTFYINKGESGYYLNDDKTIEDLIFNFRNNLPSKAIPSFVNREVVEKGLQDLSIINSKKLILVSQQKVKIS